MRTVTFSDRRVAEYVNSRFVPVWYNRGPGFHNCELRTEERIFESSPECYPTRNICTFFMTPGKEVVHYAAGYYAPDVFLEILKNVEKVKSVAGDRQGFARLHRALSAEFSRRRDRIPRRPSSGWRTFLADVGPFRWRDHTHRHRSGCLRSLGQAWSYQARVHAAFQDGPIPLERVQHDYLYGNPFSEEPDPVPAAGALPRPQVPARR